MVVRRYGEELAKYHPHVLASVVNAAWKKHPQWFPTLGQLVELCDAAAKTKAVVDSDHRIEEKPFSDSSAAQHCKAIADSIAGGKAMP